MKRIVQFILLFGLLYGQNLYAQKRVITGVVTSADDKAPIPGVSVKVKGLDGGAVTKADGSYQITIRNGRILVFSYIGFETEEAEIDGKTQINVSLKAAANQLNEVSIVGSHNANRTKLNSANPVDIIDIKALQETTPQVTVTQLLQYVSPSFHSSVSGGGMPLRPLQPRNCVVWVLISCWF
jgi:iron complex outermembrane receptor protein